MKTTHKEAQHTPTYTPWRIWKERDCDAIGEYRLKIVDSNQFIVAELIASNEKIFPQLEKDAELMVQAVNSHEALLSAAKHFKERYESVMRSEFDYPGRPWSFERDKDSKSIRHIEAISQAEAQS